MDILLSLFEWEPKSCQRNLEVLKSLQKFLSLNQGLKIMSRHMFYLFDPFFFRVKFFFRLICFFKAFFMALPKRINKVPLSFLCFVRFILLFFQQRYFSFNMNTRLNFTCNHRKNFISVKDEWALIMFHFDVLLHWLFSELCADSISIRRKP